MSFTLVIVESPSKARTIQKYLDSGYKVVSSFGHLMDLPEKEFGVDIENKFTPEFVITRRASKTVNEIKSFAKKAGKIVLAADPDREGEAICYHLSNLLSDGKIPISRIELHEITKNAVIIALKSPGKIQMDLVESQITRRILDRIVGYRLSPILWKQLSNSTLSAGRVQSVVLKWICERELEIQNFKSEEYWRLSAKVKSKSGEEFFINLEDKEKKINSQKKIEELLESILGKDYHSNFSPKSSHYSLDVEPFNKQLEITKSNSEAKKKYPPPPFITASLQKEAGGKLKFSTKKTMSVAQKLYEGVYTGKEHGTTGLISYMRTDSTRLSEEFQKNAKAFIDKEFGSKYIGNFKAKNLKPEVQDAHEAIRPVDTSILPEKLKGILQTDEWNLYNLIWMRTTASLMSPEEGINQSVEAKISDLKFTASGRRITFEGFTAIYPDWKKEKFLPELKVGDKVKLIEIISEQKNTEPPARYTEASIVEKMEKEGIGRPSTYSNTIEVLYKRKYAMQKLKSIFPTDLGFNVNVFLADNIPYLFENHFTRDIEEDLDKIAQGRLRRVDFLNVFYEKFHKEIQKMSSLKKKSEKNKLEKVQENFCPLCQNRLTLRKSPKGKQYFICSDFPNCEYMNYLTK